MLTGIEPAGRQFSSVQLGLSSCVFGLVQFATRAFRAVRMADVLPGAAPQPGFGYSRSAIPLRARRSKARRDRKPRQVTFYLHQAEDVRTKHPPHKEESDEGHDDVAQPLPGFSVRSGFSTQPLDHNPGHYAGEAQFGEYNHGMNRVALYAMFALFGLIIPLLAIAAPDQDQTISAVRAEEQSVGIKPGGNFAHSDPRVTAYYRCYYTGKTGLPQSYDQLKFREGTKDGCRLDENAYDVFFLSNRGGCHRPCSHHTDAGGGIGRAVGHGHPT